MRLIRRQDNGLPLTHLETLASDLDGRLAVSDHYKCIERRSVLAKALTNVKFGRAGAENTLYFSSSDMARVTGYVYRAKVASPGLR